MIYIYVILLFIIAFLEEHISSKYKVPFWKIIILVAISMVSVPILIRVYENLIL
jgi:hypothetical protein